MLPSNSHGPQGRARTRTQTTVDSLAGRQTAMPATIPNTGPQAPCATGERCTPTAHEAARARSACHAVRWREESCGGTSPEPGIHVVGCGLVKVSNEDRGGEAEGGGRIWYDMIRAT